MRAIDPTTWSRLRRLVVPFLTSDVKWKAWGLLLVLVAIALSIAGINVLISFVQRDFITAISLKEKDEFFKQLLWYLFAFSLAIPFGVFYNYTEQRTALFWRRWLSREILKRYFANLAFYKIGSVEGIDNPDQRIEEDIRSFTQGSVSFFLIILNNTLSFIAFIGILWSISFNLIIAVIVYAGCGSLLTYFVGRPLFKLNFEQLKLEGNYRYKLVNIRDNAESIAFYRAAGKENTRVRQQLKHALDNLLRIIFRFLKLNFFIQGYNYLKPVLPIVVVAPLYLGGEIEFGVVLQSADAFVRVVESLSIIVTNFGAISSLTAVITRLGSFSEAIDSFSSSEKTSKQRIQVETAQRIAFENVNIYTPKRDQYLIKDLNLELKKGGLLISGASGFGKSSLLRVIAGLWDTGSGMVFRPPLEECVFLPQRPYMVIGSLRNQLLYALKRRGVSDKELQKVMVQVGLEDTMRRVKGFDSVYDWPNILSAGEQQRLGFARLILARPKYVFLDEATTALDSASEARLYRIIETTTENHISVGYHITLAGYHGMILELLGNGEWLTKKSR